MKMIRRRRGPWMAAVFLLGAFLMFQGPALAQDATAENVVGWVQKSEGSVTLVDSSGAGRPAEVQAGVMANDTLTTGPDGRLQVVFKDKTMLALGNDSRLLVKDAMDMDGGGRLDLEFLQGVARVVASEILSAKPEAFSMRTPLGGIGIRGTEFGSLAAADHESHVLYEGGPVICTFRQESGEAEALRVEACQKLAHARELTEYALGWVKPNQFKEKNRMTNQLADIEEKQASLGCGQ